MQAGKLRHRIEIQQPVGTTRDGAGAKKGKDRQAWTVLARLWAAVEPLAGRELYNAQQVQPNLSHRVRVRYLDGVKAKMRVKHDRRYLNIETVINLEERDRELHLMCTEAGV
jgi:SPP1 family predicted phage head-tail adaptor